MKILLSRACVTITRGLLVKRVRSWGTKSEPPHVTASSSPVIAYRSGPDESVAVKPLRKAALECLRAAHGETHPPRLGEADIAAPPRDQCGERRRHPHRLGKARIVRAERRLRGGQQ